MKKLKASSSEGKRIIAISKQYAGMELTHVYDRPSQAKIRAFEKCWEMYCNDPYASDWHICSKNTFGFSVAWKALIGGEPVIRVETKDNSYCVYLNR